MNEAAMLLDEVLAPLAADLADPTVNEICINRPDEAFVCRDGTWTRQDLDFDFETAEGVAVLLASLRGQDVGRSNPLCGGDFTETLRFQAVLPPAVLPGMASLTFRRHSDTVAPLTSVTSRYKAEGWNKWADRRRRGDRSALLDLFHAGDLEGFLRCAVHARRNILFCGATGSGKTSLSKMLLSEIDRRERILTIEDAAELVVPHPNHVRLLYSKGGAGVTAENLLEATLRMRPDRIMLQEVRDDAAYTYFNDTMTGHPGSLTTVHGENAAQAFKRLFVLIKGSPRGRAMDDATVSEMLASTIDVIVPLHHDGGMFSIGAIWFADDAAQRGETAADLLRAA